MDKEPMIPQKVLETHKNSSAIALIGHKGDALLDWRLAQLRGAQMGRERYKEALEKTKLGYGVLRNDK